MIDAQTRIAKLLGNSGLETGFAAIAVESGRMIDVNGGVSFPTASTFKVPVMVEVYAQARAGKFMMSERMALEMRHKTVGSGLLQALGAGIAPTIRDLVVLMNIVSDNTATDMLIERVGPEAVVARMRALGLHDVHTHRTVHEMLLMGWNLPTDGTIDYAALKAASRGVKMDFTGGAYSRTKENNVATANDLARLMALIARGEAGHAEDCVDMIAVLEQQHYVDRVPRYLPTGSTANKTGSLRGLRNDIGLIRRAPGDTIAYALFTFDGLDLPAGNSRELADMNVQVASLMGEVGQVLWDAF
jgi:beta-lactamase class A